MLQLIEILRRYLPALSRPDMLRRLIFMSFVQLSSNLFGLAI